MNNNRRISFISHVTDRTKGESLRHHLNSLISPPGCAVTKNFIEGEYCLAQAYNIAMNQSAAKYKIYMNQNTKIDTPFFLNRMLAVFQSHPELGMLGVVGAKELPRNGNWRDAPERYGKISYSGILTQYYEIGNDYETVQVIDGLLMATQYDIPWREDLLLREFFLDSAQCLEFIKNGYQVGVARQHEPWCSYDMTTDSMVQYFQERDTFIKEYANSFTLPLSV